MPIFKYKCIDCSHVTEFLSLRKEELEACESCDSKSVEKMLTTATAHFKGGGWADEGYQASGANEPVSVGGPVDAPDHVVKEIHERQEERMRKREETLSTKDED